MSRQKALLLNTSNMDTFPVYPYAFIQVPAIARRAGVEVVCQELLGIPKEAWKSQIQTLIKQHNPAMILITLRNTDSLTAADYQDSGQRKADGDAYFPIERTKELILAVRAVSSTIIVLGGFGFSLLANDLMHYLRPDFGVVGGPDSFFIHFDDILQGNYSRVANLLFFHQGRVVANKRELFSPLAGGEYTPVAIKAMMAFYDQFPTPGFQGAPVEIMRGCCHTCVFCSEPHVVGSQVRYRKPSAVMQDIQMLVDSGVRKIYAISSELNPDVKEYILNLADKIKAFNDNRSKDQKVTWFGANYLLNFSSAEYERLYQSGFTGGWFDITALDDGNARAMRTPYRNERLVKSLKTYVQFERRLRGLSPLSGIPKQESPDDIIVANTDIGPIGWTMFLGNPATTIETIRNTLRVAHQEGLAKLFQSCFINTNVRVFDYEEPDAATLAVAYSVETDFKHSDYRQILPSFAYPPALLEKFGSAEQIIQIFEYIGDTFLSTKYVETRDWLGFIRRETTAARLASWIAALPGSGAPDILTQTNDGATVLQLQDLYSQELQDLAEVDLGRLAKRIVDWLLDACMEEFPENFRLAGLPTTVKELDQLTPYELAKTLFSRWTTHAEVVAELIKPAHHEVSKVQQDLLRFCALAILYRFDLRIEPEYQQLFV